MSKMIVKINSKKEAIKWTKWLRKKLTNWEEKQGYKGYKKASIREKIEFLSILRRVESFILKKNL